MDRTADFRQLVRRFSGGVLPQASEVPASTFMEAAREQQQKLKQLRSSLREDINHAAAIRECELQMKGVEGLLEDNSGLQIPPGVKLRDHQAHRRALITAMYEELKDIASQVQTAAMEEQRREAEFSNLFLTSSSSRAPVKLKPPPLPQEDGNEAAFAPLPDAAEGERLEAEARELLAAYETDLDKIVETQAKIGEVANLVSLFSTKVVEQEEQIETIHEMAEESTALIDTAGKHLDRAVQNKSSYRAWLVCWFVGSALFLLAYDYVDARYSII